MILFCNKAKNKTKFQLSYNEAIYANVSLVNEQGIAIIEAIKNKTLNINELEKGFYFFKIL